MTHNVHVVRLVCLCPVSSGSIFRFSDNSKAVAALVLGALGFEEFRVAVSGKIKAWFLARGVFSHPLSISAGCSFMLSQSSMGDNDGSRLFLGFVRNVGF